MSIGGVSSADFMGSNCALRILYDIIKDSIPGLAADGFTQSNPSVVTTAAARSTTLPAVGKRGVIAGTVAFLRPDVGGNMVGGAALISGAYTPRTRPIGLFINDAAGNLWENAPAVGSGKCPHLRGGSCGVKVYETAIQTTRGGGTVGQILVYSVGDRLYASVNGLLTNRWEDSFEAQWISTATVGSGAGGAAMEPDVTRMGTVYAPPDETTAEMFLALSLC